MDDQISAGLEVSLRAYARHRKVALSAVQKAITTGRIKKTPAGRINMALADRSWTANTDIARRPADSRLSHASADEYDDDEDIDADAEKNPITSDYQRHRTDREEIRKKKEQIELNQLMGLTLDLAEAQRLIFTAMRTIRDAVMSVPVRNKDILAAEKDPSRIEELLERELAAALQAIDINSALKEPTLEEEMEDGSD